MLATCAGEKKMFICDVRQAEPVSSLGSPGVASLLTWSRHDVNMLASTHDGNIKLWVREHLSG